MTPKNLLYAVDPGKKHSAVAAFLDGELVGVWFANEESAASVSEGNLGQVVMEQPRAYPGSPVRANDLLDLTNAGMAVAAQLTRAGERVMLIQPQAWKGQLPKPVTRKRIEAKLSPDELERAAYCMSTAKGEKHNLWDAIGIGLFALNRTKRGCV